MIFNKISGNIDYEKYDESEEKIGLHISLPRETREKLNELKVVYDELAIDKNSFIFSVFIGMLIEEYFDNVTDDVESLIEIMGKMKLHQRKCNL